MSEQSSFAVAETLERKFLSGYRLCWQPSDGVVTLECEVDSSAISEATYAMNIDGEYANTVLRTSTGLYTSSRSCFVPSRRTHSVSLSSIAGKSLGTEEIELLADNENIRFHSLESFSIHEPDDEIDPERSWIVVHDSRTKFEPELSISLIEGEGVSIGILFAGWSRKTQAILDGRTIWKCERTNKRNPETDTTYRIDLENRKATPRLGSAARFLLLNIPEGRQLKDVTLDGNAISFNTNNYSAQLSPVVIDDRVCDEGMPFIVTFTFEGKIHSVHRYFKCDLSGLLMYPMDGEPMLVRREEAFTVEAARWNRFSFNLPPLKTGEKKELRIFEGEEMLGPLPARKTNFPGVRGLGAPLQIRKQFNWDPGNQLVLIESVTDSGLIKSVECSKSKKVVIQLTRPIEFSNDYQTLAWRPGQAVEPLVVGESNGRELIIDCADFRSGTSIALAYRGSCIGVSHGDLFENLNQCNEITVETLSILRWFRAPVLSSKGFSCLEPICSSRALMFIAAWYFERGLPSSLRLGSNSAWLPALRSLLFNWQPSSEDIQELLSLFTREADESLNSEKQSVFTFLSDVSPRLARVVASAWIAQNQALGRLEKQTTPESLGRSLLTLNDPMSVKEAERRIDWLKNGAEKALDIDHFLDNLLKEYLKPGQKRKRPLDLNQQNIRTALSSSEFRRYALQISLAS